MLILCLSYSITTVLQLYLIIFQDDEKKVGGYDEAEIKEDEPTPTASVEDSHGPSTPVILPADTKLVVKEAALTKVIIDK